LIALVLAAYIVSYDRIFDRHISYKYPMLVVITNVIYYFDVLSGRRKMIERNCDTGSSVIIDNIIINADVLKATPFLLDC